MTPRSIRQLTPNIHEIGAPAFQRLCNELLSHEPDINKSDEYGRSGQGQRGIDVLGSLKTKGIDVGQCKCEHAFSDKKVRQAGNVFIKHWRFWKNQGVRRFILFVACEANDTAITDEELNQRKRFAKLGVGFELWNSTTIRNKLRPYRATVSTYFDSEEVVDAICGTLVEPTATLRALDITTNRLGVFASELEELRGKELESLRELSRAGDQSKALAGVQALQKTAAWPDHSSRFRARVLRFEAAVRLNLRQNPKEAEILVSQARQLDPSGDYQTVDAYLAYCQNDAPRAMTLLTESRSIEARNFRWALLLESGNYDTVAREASGDSIWAPDAETHRLLALSAIAGRNFTAARLAIARAQELAPTRRGVRQVKAMVDYFSALSPAAEGSGRLSWPVPVPWTYVKRDTTAVSGLESAAQIFAECGRHPDCPEIERDILSVWELACLACLSLRQTDASDLAAAVILRNPGNHGAIAWAIERHYAFDHDQVKTALRARLTDSTDQVESYLALWAVTFAAGDLKASEAMVDEAEAVFRQGGHANIWQFHKLQFIAQRGDRPGAQALAQEITDPRLRELAELNLLRRNPQTATAERKALADRLAANFASDGNSRSLLECCDLYLRLGDFKYVAAHARELVAAVGTAAALRLALDGAWRNEDYQLTLDLIEEHRDLFFDGALSPDVRQMRTLCRHKLGDWLEALQDAERLYREQHSLTTFTTYFELLVQSGDTRRCSTLSRDLLAMARVKPTLLLRAAAFTQQHDPELAKVLWHRANRHKLKDLNLVAGAMDLAFRLGLSREAEPLMQRLLRAAKKGQGPLQLKTFDELLNLHRRHCESGEKNSQLYMQGAVPIHLLAEQMGVPLATFYRKYLTNNRAEPNLFHTPIIFARAGNRSLRPVKIKGIVADITALLLAADLGILDEVEATLGPILISPHVTPCLMEQVRQISPNQPDRREARAEFLRLIGAGRIVVVALVPQISILPVDIAKRVGPEAATLLETASKEQGIVLSDGPLLDVTDPLTTVELPPAAGRMVRARREFETHLSDHADSGAWLPTGSAVLVPHCMVDSFNTRDLARATERFRLIVTAETFTALKREVAQDYSAIELAQWTQDLSDRLQRGIAAKTYRVLPAATLPKSAGRNWGTTSRTLLDLMHPTNETHSVVWCDDRMVNRHLHNAGRPIIGINEVLNMLRSKNALSASRYFETLLQLRRSNVRYIPITEEEIQYHLEAAQVVDGCLEETPALATLRRYANVCMLDKDRLQPPVVLSESQSDVREFEYPLNVRRAVDEVILAVWRDDRVTLSIREAKADWLFDNLFIDLCGFRQTLIGPVTVNEVRDLVGAMLGGLYNEGVGVDFRRPAGGGPSPREAFYNWVNKRLLEPLQRLDTSILAPAGRIVGSLITGQLTKARTKKQSAEGQRLIRGLFARFVHDLPTAIREELELPADILAQLGMTVYGHSVGIADHPYDPELYWQALAEAVNGRVGHVRDRFGKHPLTIIKDRRENSDLIILKFTGEEAIDLGQYADSALPVLLDSIEGRVKLIEDHRHWFDGPEAEYRRAAAEIPTVASYAERIERIWAWRDQSPEYVYRRIARLMGTPRGKFSLRDLWLPDWERLRHHLRIAGDPSQVLDATRLATAAETLMAEEGLQVALRRLLCLPITLPASIEQPWMALDETAAVALFDSLTASARSMVAELHCVRLAALRDTPEFWGRAERMVERLYEPATARENFALFHAVLTLVDAEFGRWADGRSLHGSTRFACIWYHAARLHDMLLTVGSAPKPLTEWLEEQTEAWTADTLAQPSGYWLDVARPANATFGRLMLHGLADLVGSLPGAAEHLAPHISLTKMLAGKDYETARIRIELLRRPDLWRNALGTFLAGASDNALSALFGVDNLVPYFGTFSDEQLADAVEKLANDPHNSHYWAILHGGVGEGDFPKSVLPKFLDILRALDFADLAAKAPDFIGLSMLFSCQQVAKSNDEQLIKRMETTVLGLAQQIPDAPADPEKANHIALTLMNSLFYLAIVAGDEAQSSRRFFDYFRRFILACPHASKAKLIATGGWVMRLPLAQQTNLWPFIFTARASH